MSSTILDRLIDAPAWEGPFIGSTPQATPEAKSEKGDVFISALSTMVGPKTVGQVVGVTFNGDIVEQTFLHDLYFRIWLIPPILEMRNPRVNTDIPFALWNAYPYPNTLTAINTTDAEGLTLDLSAPNKFAEVEYRTVNLQVSPSAPLTIDAFFTFVFNLGSGTFNYVAERASVVSILPDVPVHETWEWLTNVMHTVDGGEQRVALREVPRRAQDTKLLALTEGEIYGTLKQQMFDMAGQLVLPFFQYSSQLTAPAAVGNTTIYFDPAHTDLRDGEYALLRNPDGTFELGKITTLGASSALLDAPLTSAFPAGSIVAPGFVCVVKDKSKIARKAVHDAANIFIQGTVSQARTDFKRPGSAPTIATWDGYNILTRRPLANDDVEDEFDTGAEIHDYETGTIELATQWAYTRHEGERSWLIKRVDDPTEMDYWRNFLDAAKGKQNPFLLPTYRNDLKIVGTPPDSYGQIEVIGTDYASLYWPADPFKRLVLWTASGPLYVTVTAVALTPSGNTTCTLSVAQPTGAGYTQISSISFLLKVRLASDEVTLEHYGRESFIRFPVRTVTE